MTEMEGIKWLDHTNTEESVKNQIITLLFQAEFAVLVK